MHLHQLADNLEEQVLAHSMVLEALQCEVDLSAHCNLLDLEEIHATRDRAVKRIRQLERERIELISLYCKDRNRGESISLKEIIKNCKSDMKRTLSDNRDKLKELIDQIALVGKMAANRATARITCFNEVQSAIQKALQRPPIYSVKGVIRKLEGACLVQRSI